MSKKTTSCTIMVVLKPLEIDMTLNIFWIDQDLEDNNKVS